VSSRKLRFDGWVLDPESGDLERAGARMRLQEQPVQVLRELVAHAGSVVTREQLIALLWPKGVVDFDTGLNTVIRKLRSALGDTSETPRYIETLPRRGYRFIGVLDPDREVASAVSAAAAVSLAPRVTPAPSAPSNPEPPSAAEAALVAPHKPGPPDETPTPAAITTPPVRPLPLQAVAPIAVLAAAASLTVAYALWRTHSGASVTSVRIEAPSRPGLAEGAPTNAVGFSPPPHSIAVLPFVNISGDKEQEYFSDGLTEELLNSLSRINELQVAGRTSSFFFKGKDVDLGTVAHRLNVAAVLEGSVRRSANMVRITAQLTNATTGFHLWSQTYDRSLGDVLALQTEIADAVAAALKVTMLGDVAAKIELGGTRNPAALDAYLRATNAHFTLSDKSHESPVALAAYSEAVRLDPKFTLALAGQSMALNQYAASITGRAKHDVLDRALIDAREAIALTPELAEGHLALAVLFERSLDFAQATTEYNRALALAPGNARVLRDYGQFAVCMGRADEGISAARRAAVLDPLNPGGLTVLGYALFFARRYDEALTAFQRVISLSPDYSVGYAGRGFVYYALGDFQSARSSCEAKSGFEWSQACLAMVYDKLGRHKDAESALAGLKASRGDSGAYDYAYINAQWGNGSKALEWLETALRLRDDGLEVLKTDPLLDALRNEPRFQAIERELKFPN